MHPFPDNLHGSRQHTAMCLVHICRQRTVTNFPPSSASRLPFLLAFVPFLALAHSYTSALVACLIHRLFFSRHWWLALYGGCSSPGTGGLPYTEVVLPPALVACLIRRLFFPRHWWLALYGGCSSPGTGGLPYTEVVLPPALVACLIRRLFFPRHWWLALYGGCSSPGTGGLPCCSSPAPHFNN